MGWATFWARKRLDAKAARNYAEADRIRDLLKAKGFELRDRKDGSIDLKDLG
jgi:cysteinyl-tRNA synthetase